MSSGRCRRRSPRPGRCRRSKRVNRRAKAPARRTGNARGVAGSSAARPSVLAEADAGVAPAGVGMERNDVEEEAVHLLAVAGAKFAQVGLDVILIVGVEEIEELPRAGLASGGNRVGKAVPGEVAATRGDAPRRPPPRQWWCRSARGCPRGGAPRSVRRAGRARRAPGAGGHSASGSNTCRGGTWR